MSDVPYAFGLVSIERRKTVPFDPNGADRIVDGDTAKIAGQDYRLYGFDTPEITGIGRPHCQHEHEWGLLARDYLVSLLQGGAARGALNIVLLDKVDARGRPLLFITVDGVALADLMVDAQLASRYDGRGPKDPWCSCPDRLAAYEEHWARSDQARLAQIARNREARRSAREQVVAAFDAERAAKQIEG